MPRSTNDQAIERVHEEVCAIAGDPIDDAFIYELGERGRFSYK